MILLYQYGWGFCMVLEDMMGLCEANGCYWTVRCESLVFPEYSCEIFSFRECKLLAKVSGATPVAAFSAALKAANINSV